MNKPKKPQDGVFIVGDGELTYSVAGNSLNAGQETVLLTADPTQAQAMLERFSSQHIHLLTLLVDWPDSIPCGLAIAITAEQLETKRKVLQRLACRLGNDAIIAINTESIPLNELQVGCPQPGQILGLNWSYPAHLTFFLEIIANAESDPESVNRLAMMGRDVWGKDPYTVHSGFSTRARMMAAWAREAIYLVENGYASMESVDRACRNDAGYYLPFSGNFRYMDLMGTYVYGMVMKDLNPELANDTDVPDNLESDLAAYVTSGIEVPEATFQRFSQEIRELILNYPHETFDR